MATETLPPTIVIDLGLERGEPDTYTRPTRATTAGWFGPFVLILAVLATMTAAGAPPPAPLTALISMPVGPADSYTVTSAGKLVAQTLGTLTSYDLGSGKQDWQVGMESPTYRLRAIDGLVLIRPWSIVAGDPGTAAVDVRTGAPRWTHDGSVMTITGSDTLLAVTDVRSLSSSGRRIQGPVDSIDPATGKTLWRVDVPSTAVLTGVPGPAGAGPRMLLIRDDRTMELHDLTTGRKLAAVGVPPADYDPDNPTVSGGLILLRHSTPGGTALITAYDPVTLAQQWERPAGGIFDVEPCAPLACLAGPDGVAGVDPGTGAIVWYRPTWRGVEMRGNLLVAYASPSGSGDPVGLADPATGRVVTDLHGWRPMTATVNPGSENEVLVSRTVDNGARSMVAIARPGDAQPQVISDLPPGTGDCQSVPGRLICRSTSGQLIVWAYRQKE
jgi:outer membrane protein assembly factor BamB